MFNTVKCMERNPGLTIPRYNDVISPVPWYIVISGFHCSIHMIIKKDNMAEFFILFICAPDVGGDVMCPIEKARETKNRHASNVKPSLSLITCALKRDAQVVFCKGFFFWHKPFSPDPARPRSSMFDLQALR